MTDHAIQGRAAIERAAVASPGQTVFLEVGDDHTQDQYRRLREYADAIGKKGDIHIVLLAGGVKVAKIEDAADGHAMRDRAAEERDRIVTMLKQVYEDKKRRAGEGTSNVTRTLNAHYLAGFQDALELVKP